MAEADIIDGKAFAGRLRQKVADEAARLKRDHDLVPTLAVVLVGSDPASQIYVKSKSKLAKKAGLNAIDRTLPETAREEDLLALVDVLNNDPAVHGILVQLPLPEQIDSNKILRAISPAKDVDGFHPINVGLLASGQMAEAFVPCTPLGCLLLLKDRIINMDGARAVIIGRSNLVGKPMAQLLLGENCTVTLTHSRTRDLSGECRAADILIAAVGVPELVKGDWIKPGAIVIDVGINRVEGNGDKPKLVGDVAFDEARAVAGAITPVPGGVGPMTIACLLANTVRAACQINDLALPNWSV
ncbi:MAG TPA: bifunctional methylenetetrahydrofolate dehydrogenase/methenyltetrahydrofolate cyclohydrolase FolD [Rhodobacteraceae bacterium]|nr:bifunctional methylenetetrahydrofolate dehydrogenase/methenyltetrahydrofolate cyclohydrolase FolD [Paracoccaceae bacterium]